MTRLTKKERELLTKIKIMIMQYLFFEQRTKEWGEKWTKQMRKGWQTSILRITKDITAIEEGIENMPSWRELKTISDHYGYNPHVLRCTNCTLTSYPDPTRGKRYSKQYFQQNKGTLCTWCNKGKMQAIKHHCKICEVEEERSKEKKKQK